jgi:hypothetical protein
MIDPRIESAIREAVRDHGQPDKLADRIVKWFEDVAEGNESLDEKEDYMRRLDVIFDAVEIND